MHMQVSVDVAHAVPIRQRVGSETRSDNNATPHMCGPGQLQTTAAAIAAVPTARLQKTQECEKACAPLLVELHVILIVQPSLQWASVLAIASTPDLSRDNWALTTIYFEERVATPAKTSKSRLVGLLGLASLETFSDEK